MEILVILIILLIVFGFGGFYTGRPGYAGPGAAAGLGTILYVLAVIVLIGIVLRLLGVFG